MKISTVFQPHLRLIYVFLWGLAVSALQHIPLLVGLNLAVFALLSIALATSGKSLTHYIGYWLKLNLFTLLVWLTLSWKLNEQGIVANPTGIQLALLISLRLNLILGSTRLLLIDMNESLLLQALCRLPLPAKLRHLFVLTVRYIAVLGEVHYNMDRAMRARGYRTGFNRRTLFVAAQRVALLLIHALIKAEKTEMALKARGFRLHDVKKRKANPHECP
ncbi:energy-coupling factor transporter transmembrane component T family protein [Necropsobacter massiliensis]|uniref:energy-coupling factor transporter transmembrane component T family protein n=1 Tax=Necropsobacter massiliensis TaxID=1400001 RepID=UPI000595CB69|nr:energy-coupling factor transporter transmembrane component T [Necropsobacter massiliensis]